MITALIFGLAASSALVIGAVIGSTWAPVVRAGLGLLAGAAVFVAADSALDRYTARRDSKQRDAPHNAVRSGVGLALLAAVTLDGVPENLALGVSLVEGTSWALLVAIFSSNLPEALVGAVAMREEGRDKRKVIWTWMACAALLVLATVAGRALGDQLSDEVLSAALGFAGGAVLASLADTVMPEAFERGGPYIAFATTAGFFVSFMLAL